MVNLKSDRKTMSARKNGFRILPAFTDFYRFLPIFGDFYRILRPPFKGVPEGRGQKKSPARGVSGLRKGFMVDYPYSSSWMMFMSLQRQPIRRATAPMAS